MVKPAFYREWFILYRIQTRKQNKNAKFFLHVNNITKNFTGKIKYRDTILFLKISVYAFGPIHGSDKSVIAHFYAPHRKIGGILFYWYPSVCLYVFNIYLLLLNYFSYKAHFWYEGTSHRYTFTGTKAKVKYQGHISKKMAVSRALVFYKHILFGLYTTQNLLRITFF